MADHYEPDAVCHCPKCGAPCTRDSGGAYRHQEVPRSDPTFTLPGRPPGWVEADDRRRGREREEGA